ncbi:MAG: LysE family transporter [Frankia sp.]|nr:LysE family transporter [Frankia sp.]
MIDSAAAGLFTGLSLIVAIGAQNAYVLRQGLTRAHVGLVVTICAASDITLICAATGGLGGVVTHAPAVITVIRWLGVAFLLWYGGTSLLRARRPTALHAADPAPAAVPEARGGVPGPRAAGLGVVSPAGAGAATATAVDHRRETRRVAVARAAAFTWLNPHVYVDTVLGLGSVASNEGPVGRWWFAAGACLASVTWFTCLGYGARLAAGALASPRTWQVLDLAIGVTMLAIAARLALG